MAALVALILDDVTGWRGLFWVGALPLVVLFPLALTKLPESPEWLLSRGRRAEAARVCDRFGLPMPALQDVARADSDRVGYAALASKRYALPTLLLGTMSFAGLLLTYGLNTWLPEITGQNGFDKSSALRSSSCSTAVRSWVACSRRRARTRWGREGWSPRRSVSPRLPSSS